MAISNNRKDRERASFKENAIDGGTDRRTCDITTHSKLDDVVNALGGSAGTPFHDRDQRTVTTVGVTETLISSTVPGATTRKISKVVVSATKLGKFNIKIDSTIIGSGRTGPSNMNVEFNFVPAIPATAAQAITVEYTQLRGPVTDVEAYLMANDET